MTAQDTHWQRWITGLRAGDEGVAGEFYAHYGPLLERLAGRQLEDVMQRRFGPDEVAHSVCRTFLRRVQRGDFEFTGADRVWHLLCAITLNKARKKAAFHLADKRAVRREETPGSDSSGGPPVADAAPTPAEAAEFADALAHMLAGLDDEERQIVCLKLENRTNDEVAELLECSERTVRRILKRIETRLLGDSNSADSPGDAHD